MLQALADRLPRDVVLVEETPSSRPELERRYAARASLGFLGAATGGLGFAPPAAVGVKLALPHRPVVAVVGDGASLYQVQALWSAARYRAGVVFVILANGGYAVVNRLAEPRSGNGAWPGFSVDVAGIARSLGCASATIGGHDELVAALDDVLPDLAAREQPLLLEVAVEHDPVVAP